ncbi:MAG: M23 family metallopeptidase [Candidatus Dormibacteria bacterium]
MGAPLLAAEVLGSRGLRRLLGCGCAALAAIVVLPVLVLISVLNGVIPASGELAANQVDGGSGVIIGAGEPLPPGSFSVSQGFGCTRVPAEPAPPPGYACPPDPAHRNYVRFHTGIDLAARSGVPVFAVVAGSVRVVRSAVGFGLHVLLVAPATAGPQVEYLYGHLSGVSVSNGQSVSAGHQIGAVGSSGNSTGPHLHFEVDVGARPVNPCATFPRGYLAPAGIAAAGCLASAM